MNNRGNGQPSVIRLAYFLSHPIQYQSPLLRFLAREPWLDMTVFYSSDLSVRGYRDSEFGVDVRWDVPLLDGYKYEFLPALLRDRDNVGIVRPLSRGIFQRLKRGNFDVVWTHGYHTGNALQVLLASRLLGLPVLVRSDSTLMDRQRRGAKRFLRRAFFWLLRRFIGGVLAVGKLNEGYWRACLGTSTPLFSTPYAVDNDFFQAKALEAAPSREELRREHGLESGRPVILFASKLVERKRCSDLIQAYTRLAPAFGQEPHPYLLLIGEGELRKSLEAQAHATGLDSIRFLGFKNQSELPRYFDLCDVFVLPSVDEPWGLTVNEAMNAERAVIVSDQVGCHPDLVRHGENGFVFTAGDTAALAAALRDVLASPASARAMGKRSLEIVQQFSFSRDAAGLRLACEALVTSRTGHAVSTPQSDRTASCVE